MGGKGVARLAKRPPPSKGLSYVVVERHSSPGVAHSNRIACTFYGVLESSSVVSYPCGPWTRMD